MARMADWKWQSMRSNRFPHRFLGINHQGKVAVIHTRGNNHAHIVLRGGGGRPNYDSVSVNIGEQHLLKATIPANIMIDCNHANSNKDPALQSLVMSNVGNQIVEGNLEWGNQSIPKDLKDLKHGVSVTDACVDWATTESMIRELKEKVKAVLPSREPLEIGLEKNA
jgi:3-deoxy-7-phosphoheptulonate synthase